MQTHHRWSLQIQALKISEEYQKIAQQPKTNLKKTPDHILMFWATTDQ